MSSNYQTNHKNANNFKNKGKKREKFVPNFKKRVPTGKLIDQEVNELVPKYDQIDSNKVQVFGDFPLSKRTLDGLKKADYEKPTEIQRESIGIALRGYDLLGAAKTGSGKTLAFIVPILECLYRLKWTKLDGLGALVISPTRELAYQTFEVLKKVGRFHDFSAGLVIGGKDCKTEPKVISQANIIICTPGRLLQHMDETYSFNCDNLKMLVLDEADRILDLGFEESMNSILNNLPTSRQTLLFSATQTKSIKDLARLSLKNPTYVSVHEHSSESTPKNLKQSYVVCETHDKLSFLWSFIRNHLNQKIIVFFQSCKQVKFVYEAFNKMQTGMTTMALYGTMNQMRRMEVYDSFVRKSHSCLFATDIAARGLDFPSINWVIQMDCPPDANTYIHRAGRTARYEKDGQSILVLTPSEEPVMLNELKLKRIPISKIEVNMKRIVSIDTKLQSFCASDVELKESAKRALMAYMRSLFLMSNKNLFKIESIDIPKFSASLGLVVAPRIRFLQKSQKHQQQKEEEEDDEVQSQSESQESDMEDDEKLKQLKANKFTKKKLLLMKKNKDEPLNFNEINNTLVEDNDLFTVRRVYNAPKKEAKQKPEGSQVQEEEEEEDDDEESDSDAELSLNRKPKIKTKASIVKRIKKKNLKVNEKVQFDDEGNRIIDSINVPKSVNITDMLAAELENKDKKGYSGIDIEEAKRMLQNEDKYDKELYRQRIKRMHKEKKEKEKELRRAKRAKNTNEENETEPRVFLATGDNSDGNEKPNQNYSDSGEESD